MRAIRTLYTVALTTLGLLAVTAAVLSDPLRSQGARFSIALVGALLVHSASWKRSNPFLPNERRAHDLRTEVESLLASVRALTGVGSGEARAGSLESIVTSMHSAVDRIAVLAAGSDPLDPERTPDV